nr:MAG TPA: hypothetical protein [Caudoviricetes sp.]
MYNHLTLHKKSSIRCDTHRACLFLRQSVI